MKRLRQLRIARHMSQQRLAIELNLTQAAVSKYEKGLSEPDISTLKTISELFNVSVDYLIGASDIPARYTRADLSEDDILLLNNYRRLNKIEKAKAYAYIQGLLQE